MDKDKVKLDLGCIEIQDTSNENFDDPDYYFPTLVDFSKLFYAACPDGVSWQLAWELSKKLGLDYDEVNMALDDIIEEYREMDRDKEIGRYDAIPLPGEKYVFHANEMFEKWFAKNYSK